MLSPRPTAVRVVPARVCGGVLAGLAGAMGVLLALPASWSDYPDRYPGFRLGLPWQTPYPSMLPALIAALAVAGVVAAVRPAAARAVAVVAALAGLQAAGIAVVARRDWWNFAGADGASHQRAAAGSLLAAVLAVVAVAVVVVSVLLYRTGRGRQRPLRWQVAGGVVAGVVVAVVVPALLCAHWYYTSVTAFGQFALWWSLPWGAGLVAAGTVPDSAARQTAVLSVLASVLLAVFCLAAPTVFGFGVRLPD
ncbi:hypothetical protein [Actinoplanes nipponensis]|uniref:hypothetical protein n=1 Tax=Actinoplanes nipponensis TaxID=135950 RepID=UPI001941ACE9|nr:hypothetical protein [Actinoplanes nipponensis]